MFRRPLAPGGSRLHVAPAVASWDRAVSPGQARFAAFLDDVGGAIGEPVRALRDPLALRLDVGLPSQVPLYDRHDLDNYLFPLVPKLTARLGREFASVWATKSHAASSTARVGPAVVAEPPDGVYAFDVTTTASATTTAYKQQVRDQVAAARPLPGDAVHLHLAFVVGPHRAWPNLWKPTIDALGPIVGRDPGVSEWNTRDGRITDLGLHRTIDPTAGNRVTIAIRATAGNPAD